MLKVCCYSNKSIGLNKHKKIFYKEMIFKKHNVLEAGVNEIAFANFMHSSFELYNSVDMQGQIIHAESYNYSFIFCGDMALVECIPGVAPFAKFVEHENKIMTGIKFSQVSQVDVDNLQTHFPKTTNEKSLLEKNNQRRRGFSLHLMKDYLPHDFVAKKATLIQSIAFWNTMAYLFGIGDRHLTNILVHQKKYLAYFIDFEMILGMGKNLPVSECVEMRLTPAVVLMYGYFGLEGMFRAHFYKIASTFWKHKKLIFEVNFSDLHERLQLSDRQGDTKTLISMYRTRFEKDFSKEFDLHNENVLEQIIRQNSSKQSLMLMYSGWYPYI